MSQWKSVAPAPKLRPGTGTQTTPTTYLDSKQADGKLAAGQPLLGLTVGVARVVDEARWVALQAQQKRRSTTKSNNMRQQLC